MTLRVVMSMMDVRGLWGTYMRWAWLAAGTPMPLASARAWASVRPSAGSTKTFRIFSGVLCATSSMSMPPSLLAIIATRWVALSVSAAT